MWSKLEALIDLGLAEGLYAGAALCVRGPDAEIFVTERGFAERIPRMRPVARDQAWDLASLTKVLCGAPLAMALVADGRLDLDAPLVEILPDAPPGVSARHCLQHASGLPAWRPLYEVALAHGWAWGSETTRRRLLDLVRCTPLQATPGERHVYSDLSFLLLCSALEAVGGDRVDRLWERLVRAPSGVDLRFGWPGAAATEFCPVRGGVVVGTVHDLNAAVLGGMSTHAGLFGSARAVAAAAAWQLRAWTGEAGEGLDPAVVRRFWSEPGPGSHRLGWDSPTPGLCSAGPRWPLDGVGHLGFTGCSLWVAPRQGVIVAFLANRVHPYVEGGSVPGAPDTPRYRALRALRPRLHEAVIDALLAQGAWTD